MDRYTTLVYSQFFEVTITQATRLTGRVGWQSGE
jgi:hypothetical protein